MRSRPIPFAVSVAAIVDQRILLTRREDFEIWCLPGGAVEQGESLAYAAIREMREETGLIVTLTHLVGLYSRPNFGGYHSMAVFGAQIVGGTLRPDPSEVVEVGYFGRDEIPEDLLWDQRERILDALDGIGGSVVRATPRLRPPSMPLSRAELYAQRDQSGLSRREFYRTFARDLDEELSQLEVGGVSHDR